ncbi:rCG63507 [Rattus norvegicus]|uniref:RCG63507 n=1 Tax=Rattus norvegicus TaxID=10116 RepID=A6HLC2_RAT|nr:rCG63507 [Rattus norvegicus]
MQAGSTLNILPGVHRNLSVPSPCGHFGYSPVSWSPLYLVPDSPAMLHPPKHFQTYFLQSG